MNPSLRKHTPEVKQISWKIFHKVNVLEVDCENRALGESIL